MYAQTKTVGALLCSALVLSSPAFAQTSGTAQSDGLEIHYEVHGDLDEGETPFLVLHGGMGSVRGDFGDLLPHLTELGPVVGVEQQGHGRTGGRDTAYSLEQMRRDTLAVLDALDVERAHVVGFSMGGMLGLDLAVHAPDRLETLTAISASQNVGGMRPEIAAMNSGAEPTPEALELMPSEEDFAQMAAAFANNPDGPEQFERTFEQLGAFITSDWGWSDDALAAIDVPTLLVLGDDDFSPVEHLAHMAGLIPQSHLAILPGTTHMTIMGRADWLAPMIAARISEGR